MASADPRRSGAARGAHKRLAHLVLQTGQLTVMRNWYLEVLDAHVVFENDMLSFMTFDEEHHRLALVQLRRPAPRTSMTVGLARSAYTMVELQIDNMAPDEATQYLRGPEYGSDPLGPSFDPDAMLAALRGGTPESDLITRSWAMTCPQLNVAELLLT